jgi:hypothetical protein
MKKHLVTLALFTLPFLWFVIPSRQAVAQNPGGSFQTYEYVTIRWGGRDNTHLIRANGKVEMLGPLLAKVSRPDRVDDRALYMNIVMNAVGKEGYEFAGMTTDEIVMKRAVLR